MENVLKQLRDYGRFLELEERLPQLKEQLAEGKYLLREAGLKTAQAKWEYGKLEKGGFFQRLRGNWEDRKEEAYREYRSAQQAEQVSKQELALREMALEEARQERDALAECWERYLQQRELYLASDGDTVSFMEMQKSVVAEIVLREVESCIKALQGAHAWMQTDAIRKGVSQANRKLEFLAVARGHVGNMVSLLELLPEGTVEISSYLRNPDGHILGVTSEYKQLDRLNLAEEQLRRLRKQMKAILETEA